MGVPLRQVLARYLRERLDLAPTSAEQLEVSLRLLERWYGRPVGTDRLDRLFLLEWMRWLSQGRSPATVNRKRGAIITLWNFAAAEGLCPPPWHVPKLREPHRLPVAWRPEEVARLFAACDLVEGDWGGMPARAAWRMGLLLLWDTGARLNVLWAARLADVDLAARTLFVPAEHVKGRRGDQLFRLHEQTVRAIRATVTRPRQRLWPFPYGRREVWTHLKRLLRLAGLPYDRSRMFHCIRRTVESLAAANKGIEWAAAAVGHSVEVARRSYVSPAIAPPPSLVEVLPRPGE